MRCEKARRGLALITMSDIAAVRSRHERWDAMPAPAVAAMLSTLVVMLGWRGSDLPAQLFRADLVRRYGFVVWNSQWYGGHPTVGYSVLSPVLGALIGPVVLGAISGLVSAILFDRIVHRAFGRRWRLASLWFAVATVTNLIVGRVPFGVGIMLALASVFLLQRDHVVLAAGAVVLAALSSPVAALFAAIAATAWGLASPRRRVAAASVAAAALLPVVAIAIIFPAGGMFPYRAINLGRDVALCALVFIVAGRARPVLRTGSAVYALVALVAFLVPTPLGGNVSRLAQYFAGPILACIVPRRLRPGLLVLAVPLLLWQWLPTFDATTSLAPDPSAAASYYQPMVDFMATQPGEIGRVEIPFTHRHWESDFAARSVPLARGWERQLDIEFNPSFYDGTLDAAGYQQWLADNGVRFVALPDARLDKSSEAEAALLATSLPYLQEAWSDAHWRVWRVEGFAGLVSGPARLEQLDATGFRLQVDAPGDVIVRVRPSPHWSLSTPGCVTDDGTGWTLVRAEKAGPLRVSQAVIGTGCDK